MTALFLSAVKNPKGKEQIHTIKNSNHKMPALLQQVVDMLEK